MVAPPRVCIETMSLADYDECMRLWTNERDAGLRLGPADSRPAIAAYLERNPGLSLVARDEGKIVGTVLVGHDGRRGFIYHLAVTESHRRSGIGKQLVERAVAGLRQVGIGRMHAFIKLNYPPGLAFWAAIGWKPGPDFLTMTLEESNEAPVVPTLATSVD